MSPLISTEWDLLIVGSALTIMALGLACTWALCRAAAMADRAMERKLHDDVERLGGR